MFKNSDYSAKSLNDCVPLFIHIRVYSAQFDFEDCGLPNVAAINRKYKLKPLNENMQQLTDTLCLYVCALF